MSSAARVDGRLTGGHGDGQIFSFHASKSFSTIEGGCLCSRDAELLQRAAAMRNYGQDQYKRFIHVGLNGKMSELNAIIGLNQLAKLDRVLQRRRAAAQYLQHGLAGIPGLSTCTALAGEEPVWQYLPVRVDPARFGMDRDQLVVSLHQVGILVRCYYAPACHQYPVYAEMPHEGLALTERLSAEVVALPIYNDMLDEECERILHQLRLLHLRHGR
jgi:dTDP-4-amino-4,6-dideoxyglucose